MVLKRLLRLKEDLKYALRVGVSVCLMVWLLSRIDFKEITENWRMVDWRLLILVIPIIQICTIILRSLRLKTILRSQNLRASLRWLALIQMRGTFLRSFLPGGIAGDIYRTASIAKETAGGLKSVSSILVERVVGVAAMSLVSLSSLVLGVYWVRQPVFEQLARPVLLVSGAILVASALFAVIMRTGLISRIKLPIELWAKLQDVVEQMSGPFSLSRDDFLRVILISLVIQIVVAAWYFAVSTAFDFGLSFWVFLVTVPIVELLLTVPISIGGLGVREGAFVFLFAAFGLSLMEAVSFSLLSFTIATAMRVLSGAAFLIRLDHPKRASFGQLVRDDTGSPLQK